ncbi:MAG: ATP-binding protein [Acidobacteria bacterium]|nr:ATP-binding protein [Acidobacteriota bacterium]
MRKNTPAREIRVQIDSRYEFIDLVQRMAEDLCRVVRLGRGAALNLGLAVREAVANAIKHGNRLEEGKHVLILFRVEASRLVVAVRDQGRGFDPRRVENPVAPENVYHNHGRGIFFMNAFVDDVTFTRLPSGGTEVRMEKRLDKKRPGRTPSAGAPMRQGGKLQ